VDTTSIKNAAFESNSDGSEVPMKTTDLDEMDFEVQEEAKVEEVDYDRLVRESMEKYQFPSVDLLVSQPLDEVSISHEELKGNAAFLIEVVSTWAPSTCCNISSSVVLMVGFSRGISGMGSVTGLSFLIVGSGSRFSIVSD